MSTPVLELAEVEAAVDELQRKLDRLRVLYEQYFMGIEKREPSTLLKDVVRILHLLDQQNIRNTGLRFRHRTLLQKFNSFRTYWNRTVRAIEAGTYHRDIARLKRKLSGQGVSMPSVGKLRTAADVERAMTEAAQRPEIDEDAVTPVLPSPPPAHEGASTPPSAMRAGSGTERSRRAPEEDDEQYDLDNLFSESDAPRPPTRPAAPAPPRATAATPTAPPPTSPPLATPPTQAPAEAPRRMVVARVASIPNFGPPTAPPGPATARPQPAAAAPAPAAQSKGGGAELSDASLQSVYRRFVKAKQMCGEDTSSIHLDTLSRTIERQLPKLRELHPGKEIEFQVVIRQGRAILKAKPKDE
ncbi:MAG: hypothetical protein IT371_15090 [Deltaproteobacteria bacterium]|nr:hypothetical protein [Deltaproteobacteria bacterium]